MILYVALFYWFSNLFCFFVLSPLKDFFLSIDNPSINERNKTEFDVNQMEIVWAGSGHTFEVSNRIVRSSCLRQFICRQCIYKKITEDEIECCPVCDTDLGGATLEKLRYVSLFLLHNFLIQFGLAVIFSSILLFHHRLL